jgi:hypothetical protein
MSERDSSDIDFDFFEEDAPEEEEPRSRSPLRRGPPRGPKPPPSDYTPLLRLVGLVVGAIVVVVLLVFIVDRCRGNSKQSTYENYMADVQKVATDSQQTGHDFLALLAQPGIKVSAIETQLNGLATRAHQSVTQAQGINPPGALRDENQEMITSLQLRESGLRGMSAAFTNTAKTTNATEAATTLANQANRFVASDVVWDDLFKDPSAKELASRGVRGVAVPDSNFLSDPNLVSVAQLRPVWRRIQGTTTGSSKNAIAGDAIDGVAWTPGTSSCKAPCALSPNTTNVVKASTNLAFEVSVKNSGQVQNVQVQVTLTIKKPSPAAPIVKKETITSINAGQVVKVTFHVGGVEVPIGPVTTVTAEVAPVPNEKNTSNNSVDYPVAFSL